MQGLNGADILIRKKALTLECLQMAICIFWSNLNKKGVLSWIVRVRLHYLK